MTSRICSTIIDSMNAETFSLAARARVHAALGDPSRLAIVDALLVGDSSPGDLARELSIPTNLLAHHVNHLVDAGLVVRRGSEGDRRRTYLRLVQETLDDLHPARTWPTGRVVFVCTHNSARSQLAAALWARHSDVPVASAGTAPAARIHPKARQVARRHGLRFNAERPVHIADVLRDDDLVIAVCDQAHEQLPHPDARRLHWSVPDPAPVDTPAAFEVAFTDIAGRIDRVAPTITLRSSA